MTASPRAPYRLTTAASADPILVEIVEGYLASVEQEVETAIGRTSRSPMIRDAHDYRAGIHDRHLRKLGYTEGNIEQRMRALDKTFQLPAEPDPRPEIIRRYNEMVRDAERRSTKLFNLMPKSPVDVRREPPLTEGSA